MMSSPAERCSGRIGPEQPQLRKLAAADDAARRRSKPLRGLASPRTELAHASIV